MLMTISRHTPDARRAATHVRPIAYSCTPKADAKTARLRSAVEAAGGIWRDAARLTEAELAAMIREDEVDILVELTGTHCTSTWPKWWRKNV